MDTRISPLTLAALVGLAAPAATPAADYEAHDYLPLSVGNSWTYLHEWTDLHDRFGPVSQWPAYFALRGPDTPEVTITVERTEAIDGQTYFVMSGMPAGGWPPAPPHFVAGKKLRWDGTRLMEHTGTGEQALYRFDGANEAGYTIPATEGDNRVTVSILHDLPTWPVPHCSFDFHGYVWPRIPGLDPGKDEEPRHSARVIGFLAHYGPDWAYDGLFGHQYPVFENVLRPIRASLDVGGGPQVEASGQSGTRSVAKYEDARYGRATSLPPSSWGEVKGEGEP